jgi:hypothetical protein
MLNSSKVGYLLAAIIISAIVYCPIDSSAQISDKEIVSITDTTQFQPNSKAGWGIMLGFVKGDGADSAKLELVLYNEELVNLKENQLVGRISSKQLLPARTRVCQANMGQHQFELMVEKNGSVWLRLIDGPDLQAGKKILPITVLYKL